MKKLLALILLITSLSSSQVGANNYIFDIDAPEPINTRNTITKKTEGFSMSNQTGFELLKPLSAHILHNTGFLKKDFAIFLALEYNGISPQFSKKTFHLISPFSDVSIDSFFLPYITLAKKYHLIDNMTNDIFSPNTYISHSDFLQIITNIQAKKILISQDVNMQKMAEEEMIFSSAGEENKSFSLQETLQRVQSIQRFEHKTLYTPKDEIITHTQNDTTIAFLPKDALETYSLFFDYKDTPFLIKKMDITTFPQIETIILEKINSYRTANGLEIVQKNEALSQTAQDYAKYMFENKHFEHKDLHNNNAGDRALSHGYDYAIVLENLGRGQTSIDAIMNDWKKSPSHNKNLLYPGVSDIGIGFYGNYWVLLFGQEMET